MTAFSDLIAATLGIDDPINWTEIWSLWPDRFRAMDDCPQDPRHHAEGDVGRHTRMVCEALVQEEEWLLASDQKRFVLFWTSVLHDIGKPATTKYEDDGRITSRGHSRIGAQIARELLWRADVPFNIREEICGLILAHQRPFHLMDRNSPLDDTIKLSWMVNIHDVTLHAKADAIGRICVDQEKLLENVELVRLQADILDCLEKPYVFKNDASRIEYFTNEDRSHYYTAHEDFRCQVTLMSGISGSGKNTWISKNCPDIPVVSLDDIRKEMGISPSTGNQGVVIQEAQLRMKRMLASGQDFVLNNTCIDTNARQRWLGLCYAYNARIKAVYVEASASDLFRQNRDRPFDEVVPQTALKKQITKFDPPTLLEVHEVIHATPSHKHDFSSDVAAGQSMRTQAIH